MIPAIKQRFENTESMPTKKQELTAKGNTGRFFNTTLEVLRNEPELLKLENYDRFRAIMYRLLPELSNKEKCPNCAASMVMREQRLHYENAGLLVHMGQIVRHNLTKIDSFTEANMVHVNKDERIPHNMRCVAGNTSDIGLIAKVKGKPAHWLITRRGYAALRGEAVPQAVVVFRSKIVERKPETTTLDEVMRNRKRKGTATYEYDPKDYYHIEDFAQGKLL